MGIKCELVKPQSCQNCHSSPVDTRRHSLFTSGAIMTAALSSLGAGDHLIYAAKTGFQSHISGSWCQILSLIQKVDFWYDLHLEILQSTLLLHTSGPGQGG